MFYLKRKWSDVSRKVGRDVPDEKLPQMVLDRSVLEPKLLVTCCGVPDFIVPHACWRYLVLLQEGKGIYLMVYVKFF